MQVVLEVGESVLITVLFVGVILASQMTMIGMFISICIWNYLCILFDINIINFRVLLNESQPSRSEVISYLSSCLK